MCSYAPGPMNDSLLFPNDDLIDPDPFSIGLGLIQIIAGGGAFLEARRQRQALEQGHNDRFRSTWYQSRRSLIFFKRSADEFETYMLEFGYARREFRIGSVRIVLNGNQHQAMGDCTGRP